MTERDLFGNEVEAKPFDPECDTLPFLIAEPGWDFYGAEAPIAEAEDWGSAKDACCHMVGAGEYERLGIWYGPEERNVATCYLCPVSGQPSIEASDVDFRRMERS